MMRVWAAALLLVGSYVVSHGAASEEPAPEFVKMDLTGNDWIGSNAAFTITIPSSVPGEIHTDLLASGKIDAPYYRFNDVKLQWVAEDSWTFTKLFEVTTDQLAYPNRFLVFDGLDTVASITINGHLVANVDNMYRRYVLPVGSSLFQENELVVTFTSAITAANASAAAVTGAPPEGIVPFCPPPEQNGFCHINFLRKSPCSFSWDWGPAFATQGIWRNVSLVLANNVPVLLEVAALVELVSGSGVNGAVGDDGGDVWNVQVSLRYTPASSGDTHIPAQNVTVELVGTGQTVTKVGVPLGSDRLVVNMTVTDVKAWWPNGYGDQQLYTLDVTSTNPTAPVLVQTKSVSFGFRTSELIQDPLPGGKSFKFRINGLDIFFKGANWVPADAFESRVTTDKLRLLLTNLKDANMNAVRNWGGGIYQRDEFYDICDELGLMVWEEFMFACSMYPTEPAFLESVAEEVLDNVHRLMSHPSIVVWSTNNENEAAIAEDWYGTKANTAEYASQYADLYFDTVLDKLATVDTTRPTLASSPSNGNETTADPVSLNPQYQLMGDVHYYNYAADCWNVSTYPRPRFASEFGVQSWPSFLTLSQASSGPDGDWSFNSSFMQHRQHHPDGQNEMLQQMKLHFNVPTAGGAQQVYENTLLMTQVVQAVCIKTEAEHYRRLRSQGTAETSGYTMGTLYWQANEIWQGASWASQDYYGRWKMLHYYARNFYAPTVASGYIEAASAFFYIVNDPTTAFEGSVAFDLVAWKSGPVATWEVAVKADAGSSALAYTESMADLLGRSSECATAANCVLSFALLDSTATVVHRNHLYLGDFQDPSVLANPQLTLSNVQLVEGAFTVEVSAAAVAPFVWLETAFQGVWSDNGFLMVSSTQTVTFTPYTLAGMTPAQLMANMTVTSLYSMYN